METPSFNAGLSRLAGACFAFVEWVFVEWAFVEQGAYRLAMRDKRRGFWLITLWPYLPVVLSWVVLSRVALSRVRSGQSETQSETRYWTH